MVVSQSKEIQEKYDSLQRTRSPNSSDVFYTYIGDEFYTTPIRLMIVGKATAGWKYHKGEEKAVASYNFIKNDISNGKYTSHFWHFIRTVSEELFQAYDHSDSTWSRKEIFDKIAWSNIMKIAQSGYNPSGKSYKDQRKACIELLQLEIRELNPTHLIFVTGSTYWKDVEMVLVADGWDKRFSDMWICKEHQFDPEMKVFWTRHPQAWNTEKRKRAIRAICSN